MSWFTLALIGHLANGAAFIIDKILLGSAFKRSATYAGLVGVLSLLALLALPWAYPWPPGLRWWFFWPIALGSGATFVLALWCFFESLARAEASRVVPIVGSLIPAITLAGSYLFLNERLEDKNLIGLGILMLATLILSGGGKGRLDKKTIWIAIASAALFAISSVMGKFAYDLTGFLTGFITTRLGAGLTAVFILVVLDRVAGKEFLSIFNKKTEKKKSVKNSHAAALAIFGQSLGAIGFLFVQWAIAKGSPSIVNAMQASQYALIVLIGIILYRRAPRLLGEELSTKTLALKILALILTAIGMSLIV